MCEYLNDHWYKHSYEHLDKLEQFSYEFSSEHLMNIRVDWKIENVKMYYGHEVPVVIHKNKDISLFTF